MNVTFRQQRTIATVAILAGGMAILSLVVGLAGVDWDSEVLSEASSILEAGEDLADYIGWSFWLSAFGTYLLMAPLALLLFARLRSGHEFSALLYTAGGVAFLLLGAVGSAIFAIAWPELIREYAAASPAEQGAIAANFELVGRVAGAGFHGVVQNLLGALWLIGIGTLMRAQMRILGALALVIGVLLVINSVGNLADVELLSTIGIMGHVILTPMWAILVGLRLIATSDSALS